MTTLADLEHAVLSPAAAAFLDACARSSQGSATWKARKRVEAHELLALAERAPRLQVLALDLRTTLRALLALRGPVPCLPDLAGPLVVADRAQLALRYTEEAIASPQPGWAFVTVIAPPDCWHSNIARNASDQRVCLGTRLPAGIPVRELVLATYGALTMQTVQIDERSPAGVLNADAARWWQRNGARIPLSRVPFLGTADLTEGAAAAAGGGR